MKWRTEVIEHYSRTVTVASLEADDLRGALAAALSLIGASKLPKALHLPVIPEGGEDDIYVGDYTSTRGDIKVSLCEVR